MKTVRLIRGGQPYPWVMDNGDKYDSVAIVTNEDDVILYVAPLVNTDYTEKYRGGILSEGNYYAICGTHKNKYRALNLFRLPQFQNLSDIKSPADLTEEMRTLPSLVENPNNGGLRVIKYVNDHLGGADVYDENGRLVKKSWDYSHGCITHPSWMYGKYMSLFNDNEIVRYFIQRSPLWIHPQGAKLA